MTAHLRVDEIDRDRQRLAAHRPGAAARAIAEAPLKTEAGPTAPPDAGKAPAPPRVPRRPSAPRSEAPPEDLTPHLARRPGESAFDRAQRLGALRAASAAEVAAERRAVRREYR